MCPCAQVRGYIDWCSRSITYLGVYNFYLSIGSYWNAIGLCLVHLNCFYLMDVNLLQVISIIFKQKSFMILLIHKSLLEHHSNLKTILYQNVGCCWCRCSSFSPPQCQCHLLLGRLSHACLNSQVLILNHSILVYFYMTVLLKIFNVPNICEIS